jgi:hypothetical protein
MSWNPKEAGRMANAKDSETARKQIELDAERKSKTQIERNRRQRGPSVVGPTVQHIMRFAQAKAGEFNAVIENASARAEVLPVKYGLGPIPHEFDVRRGIRSVRFTPNYNEWAVTLAFSDGTSKNFEVVEDPATHQVSLKGSDDRQMTEEDVALEGCKFALQ